MINADKYKRSVTLHCPTCGKSQFAYDPEDTDDTSLIRCTCCEKTLTRAQLIDANSDNVSAHVEKMGKDLVSDLQKDLTKTFAGNRFIKIK